MLSRMDVNPSKRILLVEDEEVDRLIIKRALGKNAAEIDVTQAADGIEALETLRGNEGCSPLEPPFLVLLDLNMPRMGGLEFLAELRKDAALKRTVVFVLTTSAHEDDLRACYDFGVAGYMYKQQLTKEHRTFARFLDDYLTLVRLPS